MATAPIEYKYTRHPYGKAVLALRFCMFTVSIMIILSLILARGSYVSERYFRWILITPETEFSWRDSANGFKFDGWLYLSGGYNTDGKAEHDLWRSRDGRSWEAVATKTPYDGYAPIALLGDRIVATLYSSWLSADARRWIKLADGLPFGMATVGSMASFEEKLVFVDESHVWESSTGEVWNLLTPSAPFGRRYAGNLIAFAGRLLYVGGATTEQNTGEHYDYLRSHADVWASTDGETWRRVTANAGWSPRMWASVVEHRKKLWLFGGFNNRNKGNFGDLWVSDDGETWRQPLALNNGPSPRHASTAFSVDEGLLVVAGNAWPLTNDVWLYRDASPLGRIDEMSVNLEKTIIAAPRKLVRLIRQLILDSALSVDGAEPSADSIRRTEGNAYFSS